MKNTSIYKMRMELTAKQTTHSFCARGQPLRAQKMCYESLREYTGIKLTHEYPRPATPALMTDPYIADRT